MSAIECVEVIIGKARHQYPDHVLRAEVRSDHDAVSVFATNIKTRRCGADDIDGKTIAILRHRLGDLVSAVMYAIDVAVRRADAEPKKRGKARTIGELREAVRAATSPCADCGWFPDDRGPQHSATCSHYVMAYMTTEPPKQCVAVPPTVEQLARALFETDERTQAFVTERAECAGFHTCQTEPSKPCDSCERRKRVMQLAWDRREPSDARDDADERAAEIRAVLLQCQGEKP